MAHVRKGDNVIVLKGRERGKQGKVKRVLSNGRIEIEKVMMVKKHVKASQKDPQGGIRDVEGSVAVANVALFCNTCGAGRRSKKQVDDAGNKQRVCVKCNNAFATPAG